jgi:signal transduction histidine kinase
MWKGMNRFLRKKGRLDNLLIEFEDSLLLIVDVVQLAQNLRSKLKQFIDVEDSVVYLADTDRSWRSFQPVDSAVANPSGLPPIDEGSRTANWLAVNHEVLVLSERSAVTDYLRDELHPFLARGLKLAFPLNSMDRLIGIVFVHPGPTPLNAEQSAKLKLLGRQAGLAFGNALLFRERLRQNERMYRAEQLATMGEFAAGIAHELRNPLTAIRSTVQFLADDFKDGSEQQRLSQGVLDEVDRLNTILGHLLSLARPAETKPTEVDLEREIAKCVAFVATKARSQQVEVQVECDEGLPHLFVDPTELQQVLLNIMMNGLQAMPEGGTLSIKASRPDETRRSAVSRSHRILIKITDEGPGVPDELREKVFEPFFTTKSGGTGLGLAICGSIVKRYDGDVWIERTESGGTSVNIALSPE